MTDEILMQPDDEVIDMGDGRVFRVAGIYLTPSIDSAGRREPEGLMPATRKLMELFPELFSLRTVPEVGLALQSALAELSRQLMTGDAEGFMWGEDAHMEAGGYSWCYTCGDWEDDTHCYPDDHSRHCGHHVKPVGVEVAEEKKTHVMSLVLTCLRGPRKTTSSVEDDGDDLPF